MNNTDQIASLINHINLLTQDIEKLQDDKMECESQLREYFSHYHNCSKTYKYENYKVTITDGYNYSLRKDEYENIKSLGLIELRFPIVKEVVKYELNKRAISDCEKKGTEQEKELLDKLIFKTDKKLHVSIKLNLQDLPHNGEQNV